MTTMYRDSLRNGRQLAPADLFNGYVGAHVAFAMHQLRLFDALRTEQGVGIPELAAATGADPSLLGSLLQTARRLGYVRQDDDGGVALTPEAADLARLQGFFTWAVGGYADVLGQLAPLTTGARTFSVDVFRNEGNVAVGASEVDATLMVPILDQVLDTLELGKIADLGCGNAARLIRLCRRHPLLRGIGVDISEDACRLARDGVAAASLESRISIVCADVLAPAVGAHGSGAGDVDLVSSFFMLHDLFARYEHPSAALEALRQAFPAARSFLLADTVQSDAGLPIFSLAFELVHAFMGVPLHTKESYETFFAEAGFSIERCVPFGAPSSWLYLLRA